MTIGKDVVERELRAAFDEPLAALGFEARRGPAWRTAGGLHELRLVWDSKMRDELRGRSFTLEFQNTAAPRDQGRALTGRVRLPQLLDEEQADAVARQQNRVVARFPRPSSAELAVVPGFLREQYLSYFEPVEVLGPRAFLSVVDAASAAEWAQLLAPMLPTFVRRALQLRPDELWLGRRLGWLGDDLAP